MNDNNAVVIGQTDICVVCGQHIRDDQGKIMDVRNETCCVGCISRHDDPCAEQLRHVFRG